MTVVVVVGLPGVGKTSLALGLAAAMADRHLPVLALHTDAIKVTARALDSGAPREPGWADAAGAIYINRLLAAQVDKAARDGYSLVIEGTMAHRFCPVGALRVELELDEVERLRRCAQKHEPAARALAAADLDDYRRWLEAGRGANTLALDANESRAALVSHCMRAL